MKTSINCINKLYLDLNMPRNKNLTDNMDNLKKKLDNSIKNNTIILYDASEYKYKFLEYDHLLFDQLDTIESLSNIIDNIENKYHELLSIFPNYSVQKEISKHQEIVYSKLNIIQLKINIELDKSTKYFNSQENYKLAIENGELLKKFNQLNESFYDYSKLLYLLESTAEATNSDYLSRILQEFQSQLRSKTQCDNEEEKMINYIFTILKENSTLMEKEDNKILMEYKTMYYLLYSTFNQSCQIQDNNKIETPSSLLINFLCNQPLININPLYFQLLQLKKMISEKKEEERRYKEALLKLQNCICFSVVSLKFFFIEITLQRSNLYRYISTVLSKKSKSEC